jgi:two-component system, response regulator YesN
VKIIGFFKDLFKNIKSRVFCRIFFILLFITLASVVSSAFSSLIYSTNHIINQVSRANISMLSERRTVIDEKIKEIDKLAYQGISDNNLWNIMRSEVFTENHYFMIKDVIKLFNSIALSNDMIASIYLHDSTHLFVITNTTKYTKEDFFDQEILQFKLITGNIYLTPPRMVGGRKVITYIRKFNAFTKDNVGYISINIDYNKLFGQELAAGKDGTMPLIILNKETEVYYSDNKVYEALIPYLGRVLESRNSYDVYNINKHRYFIIKIPSSILDWTFVCIEDYSRIIQPAQFLVRVIIGSLAVVLLLLLLIAYKFSSYLYKPVSNIIESISVLSDYNKITRQNEYEIIDQAMKELHSSNKELASKYDITFPYFQNYSIHEILANQNFEDQKFSLLLSLFNKQFVFDNYSLAIIDFENRTVQAQDKQSIELLLGKYKEAITAIVTVINSSRMLLVLNVCSEIDSLYKVIDELKQALNKDNVSATISLGSVTKELSMLPVIYDQVLKQLDNRFFIGKNKIIHSLSSGNNCEVGLNCIDDEERIVNHIKACNYDKAIEFLDSLIKHKSGNELNSIEYIKYQFFQLYLNIADNIKGLGIQEEELGGTKFNIFQSIQKSETIDSLRELLMNLISKSIQTIYNKKENRRSEIIEQIIKFMQQNYANPLTLDDIAAQVYLSPKYMCGIFKEEVGVTIFDFLTKIRMEKAKELLIESDMHIQNIGLIIGYNNVQSFIRFFKKYCSLTPEQYRKTNRIKGNLAD